MAAAAVRADLLGTYDSRLRAALAAVQETGKSGFGVRRAEEAAAAQGYWRILRRSYAAERDAGAARRLDAAFGSLVAAASAGRGAPVTLRWIDNALEGFRAVPLGPEEQIRRAGQLQRFLELVPIEYDRGVENGRVTLDFEIQEAITFRDAASSALGDLAPFLLRRDPAATRAAIRLVAGLGVSLADATRGRAVADPEAVRAAAKEALDRASAAFPEGWGDAKETADFDVIEAALDRVQAAAAAGEWGVAEQARLEAYGVFELGPEQRLRGLAPGLFRSIEGLFWYGDGGSDGLVQLVKRKAAANELAATRAALDDKLGEAETRIGAGLGSRTAVVVNSSIIVFREGLEAVLILAALMASMVGAQRRLRRPLLGGVLVALVASAVTWVVAQTVLGSLAGWGERLEAVVSLVAIGVLLLILNWFYHRVYWQENLHDLHRKKKRVLAGASVGILSAQALGLVAARLLERLPRGLRDGALPPGPDSRGRSDDRARGRGARLRGRGRRVPARHRARAEAAAQADAGRDRRPHHRRAGRARRPDRADDAGRRLASRQPGLGRAAVLVGRLARGLPDVGGADRPGRRSLLRRRELRRRRGVACAEAEADHRPRVRADAVSGRPPRRDGRAPVRGASPTRDERLSASRAWRRRPRRGRYRRSRATASRRRRPARS